MIMAPKVKPAPAHTVEEDFKYLTAGVEDVKNKPFLYAAIRSHLVSGPFSHTAADVERFLNKFWKE